MVCPKPDDRINLSQIKKHPWLLELTNSYDEIKFDGKIELMKKNGISSPKKIKVKNLSHNPSFIKKEKKFEKKSEKNISDNKSNHSDDSNQKISNKQNLMNFPKCSEENKIPNLNNSLLKELEIKYLKELATRKFNIDKILKEQEDDND